MKVKEIIKELSKFHPEMDVVISDGFIYKFYKGSWEIKEFEGTVDIGVGGTDIEEEYLNG